MTPSQSTLPPEIPENDAFTKVLEAFCTVATRFEKDIRQVGAREVPHLIAVARAAAEEALTQHQQAKGSGTKSSAEK